MRKILHNFIAIKFIKSSIILGLTLSFFTSLSPANAASASSSPCPTYQNGQLSQQSGWENHFPFDIVMADPSLPDASGLTDVANCPIIPVFGQNYTFCIIPMIFKTVKDIWLVNLGLKVLVHA